jgi:hypothetical protein
VVNTIYVAVEAVPAGIVGSDGRVYIAHHCSSGLTSSPNQARHRMSHLVTFLIFISSNAGGLLTLLVNLPEAGSRRDFLS